MHLVNYLLLETNEEQVEFVLGCLGLFEVLGVRNSFLGFLSLGTQRYVQGSWPWLRFAL